MALPAAGLGCGASSSGTVASVRGSGISRDSVERWTAIKSAELQASSASTSTSPAQLRQRALAFLITGAWLEEEAAAQDVSAPRPEVEATYQRLLNGPAGPAFAAGLRRRGIRAPEELLLLRLAALAQKLRAKIVLAHPGASPAQMGAYVSAYIAAYRVRWRQRTSCRPGYVIAECANGPPLPTRPGSAP